MFLKQIPGDFTPPSAQDDYDKELLSNLSEVGWHNLHIAGEEALPPFSFSIGHFHNANHPEIIVAGLPPETSEQLLNVAAVHIHGEGQPIEPFRPYEDFLQGLNVAFIPVGLEHYGEFLGYANWYYDDLPKPYPVMQMVWPDPAGLFPWEEGFDGAYAHLQPLLMSRAG